MGWRQSASTELDRKGAKEGGRYVPGSVEPPAQRLCPVPLASLPVPAAHPPVEVSRWEGGSREQLKMLSRPPSCPSLWPHGSRGAASPSHWLSPGYSSLLFSIFPVCKMRTKMPAPRRVSQSFPGVGISPRASFFSPPVSHLCSNSKIREGLGGWKTSAVCAPARGHRAPSCFLLRFQRAP